MSACGFDTETRSTTVFYRVDRQDRIVAVNDTFWMFAADNDGALLRPDSVLGRPLAVH